MTGGAARAGGARIAALLRADNASGSAARSRARAAAAILAAAILASAACFSCAGRAAPAAAGSAEGGAPEGRVFGEFEDAGLFRKSLESAPVMRAWSEREVRDGLSGATIQAKTMGGEVPDRIVLENGKILAYADGYGQYWVSLSPGEHELVGRCRGYRDAKVAVEVESGSAAYANFYLERR